MSAANPRGKRGGKCLRAVEQGAVDDEVIHITTVHFGKTMEFTHITRLRARFDQIVTYVTKNLGLFTTGVRENSHIGNAMVREEA
jgi:hypothetical protein